MNIVQASFQASFDSQVERLSDVDLANLRVIFRYFDTDGDGTVSADQAYRMFALLGLDVNRAQVRELGEVYLNEFIKIVDSHEVMPPPPATATEGESVEAGNVENKMRTEESLESEWRLLDTSSRGRVSKQELRLFAVSCQSTLSLADVERFLETYGSTVNDNGINALELTKEGFLKFRHENDTAHESKHHANASNAINESR